MKKISLGIICKRKFGSSLPTKPTRFLCFILKDEEERDRILKELQTCVQKVDPDSKVFIKGPALIFITTYWRLERMERSDPDQKPRCSSALIERIKKLLYGKKRGESRQFLS